MRQLVCAKEKEIKAQKNGSEEVNILDKKRKNETHSQYNLSQL